MIELSLWRARVGCFLNIRFTKSLNSLSKFTNLQTYFLILLLLNLNIRLRRIQSTFFITLISLIYTYHLLNIATVTDDKVINLSFSYAPAAIHRFLNLYPFSLSSLLKNISSLIILTSILTKAQFPAST